MKKVEEYYNKQTEEIKELIASVGCTHTVKIMLFEFSKQQASTMKTFCIEVERESEEQYTFHIELESKPTREEVLKLIDEEDIGYDDNYGRFNYYQVN